MSLVKFIWDMSGIIFPDIKVSYNKVTLDSAGFPLVILVVCKAFPQAKSDSHIFLTLKQLLLSPWECCQ